MTRILVLEDDENLRELLRETLEDEGYVSEGAANGAEAIAKVSGSPFDALIVDVRMEGMSGLEAFAYMRQQGAELACLVITGFATEEDSIRAIRLGVGDYLRKPFQMSELLQRLARVVAVSTRQRQSWQREQHWVAQSQWLHGVLCPAEAARAGERAAHIGAGLQLDGLACLELRWAASLLAQGLPAPAGQGMLAEAVQFHQENWDGSGPNGLAGEAIPLAARIVRLALLSDSLSPAEVLRRHEGIVDPDLLFALEPSEGAEPGRQVRRLIELARSFLNSGQSEEAALALRRAEPLVSGPAAAQVALLLASLEPAPLRRKRLQALMASARAYGGRHEAHVLAESGLILLEAECEEAMPVLREAAARSELSAETRLLCLLGLWTLGQAPPQWDPAQALATLLRPEHEPQMFRALKWLAPALLRWWLLQSDTPPVLWRWLRHASSALLPAFRQLNPTQRLELMQRLESGAQAPPGLLQGLAQESDTRVKTLAQQIARVRKDETLPPLHLRSFGTFSVFSGGRPIEEKAFRGIRNRIVLAFLASSPRPIPEEKIRETFWPDDLEKGRKGLYNALFHIRRALRPEGWTLERDYLCRQVDQLGLDLELDPWHDVWDVERSLAGWKTLTGTALQSEVDRVLELTEAPYLDGCYMDWALERRAALEQQLASALWLACEKMILAEAWQPVHDWSTRLLTMEPEHQRAAAGRMRALCGLGRPEEALRTFEQISRRLRQEFEIEPSTELIQWQLHAKMMV